MNRTFNRGLLERVTQVALIVSVLAMCVLLWARQREASGHRERMQALDQLLSEEQQQLSYANELLGRAQQMLNDVELRKARLQKQSPETPQAATADSP